MQADINQLIDWTPSGAHADAPTVSAQDHCGALRRLAGHVMIVTTCDGDTPAGLTATAVASVTAEPPRLVVFVNKKVAASPAILSSGILCVNILSGDQEGIARVFAGMVRDVAGQARFAHGEWDRMATGAPALVGALANLDCRVVKIFDESTHHAFLCEVLATRESGEGDALIYLNGAFRHLSLT